MVYCCILALLIVLKKINCIYCHYSLSFLQRLYVALATLTEPHQLTATLNCVTSVARALVRPDASYPAGRRHVLTLLQLVLPGIDPNDFRKSLASFFFFFLIYVIYNTIVIICERCSV